MNTLKYVRPGSGFEPAFPVFGKVNVNGKDAHPLFQWLRRELPIPQDPEKDSKGNGCSDSDVLILPRAGFGGSTVTLWTPVTRTDVAWNFEKFLLKDGKPFKRYSRYYPTAAIEEEIAELLNN